MFIHDLALNEFLSHDIESGLPAFGSDRLLILKGNSLVELLLYLSDHIGMDRMRPILCRFGLKTGLSMALSAAGLKHHTTPEAWMHAGFLLARLAGIANSGHVRIDYDHSAGQVEFSGLWRESISTNSWMARHDELSRHPVCAVVCAIFSGIASVVMGHEVIVRETRCQAMGHTDCVFEGRSSGAWGGLADQLRPYLIEELEHVDFAEIRMQARHNCQTRSGSLQGVTLDPIRESRPLGAADGFVYRSREMHQALILARKVAPTRSSVLILGESGVGKEMIARYIHRNSSAHNNRFVAVNCAALPQPLLESELFGHIKGAFTGADNSHKGLFVEAGEGTLFLDEVGELPLELQAKLLRVLNEREVRPVGGVDHIPVAARIVAATNQQLRQEVEQGRFRSDLFFRLAVFPIEIPPLRRRRHDILPLARYFVKQFHPGHPGMSIETVRRLHEHAWPGNVRELKNWIEFALILAGSEKIQPGHWPPTLAGDAVSNMESMFSDLPPLKDVEARYAKHVLAATGGNRKETARILGISDVTLWRRIKSGDW